MADTPKQNADRAGKRAGRTAWAHNDKESPFIIANTYDDLQRIMVKPPAMGFVRFQRKVEAIVVYDDVTHLPKSITDKAVLVPCARYFVLTYPPAPKLDFLTMRDVEGHEQVWSTKIYQPSAGLSGSLVYFDDGIPLEESTIGTGVQLGYPEGAAGANEAPLYKITNVKTKTDLNGKQIVESITVDYANGMKTNELAWLEIEILPPWGQDVKRLPLNADYATGWQLPTFVPPDLPSQ